MIIGYEQLALELDGLFTVGSLRVLDCHNKLPLTRQWHEGKRCFDPIEVQQFKEATIVKREQQSQA